MNQKPTPAVDVLLTAIRALRDDEQDRVIDALVEARLQRHAADGSLSGRMIASLVRVAEEVGRTPTISDYRQIQPILTAAGADLVPFGQLYKYFDGMWARAIEAFELADVTTPRMIESRLRRRRMGKVNRYSDETMRATLALAVEAYGYPPSVDEFDAWRERELELARQRGDNGLQLPSPGPYRRRWKSWIGALEFFGYDTTEVGAYRYRACIKASQSRRAAGDDTHAAS